MLFGGSSKIKTESGILSNNIAPTIPSIASQASYINSAYDNIKSIKKESGSILSPLLMYSEIHKPNGKIEFDDFASLALERFSVLQLFENVASRYMKGNSEYMSKLDTELRKIGFLKSVFCYTKDSLDQTELNKDIISHFILRLAFCQTEELKRWFIQQEIDLFKYKLNRVSNDSQIIEKFIRDNDLHYTPITESEKQSIMDSLIETGFSATQITHQNFYKICFLEVLDLVKSRKVFIKDGFAFVNIAEFGSVLTHVFRTRLSKSLTMLSRHVKEIEEDPRIFSLLKILRDRDVGESYADTNSRENLTAESIDQLSIKSFPMCMKHLHESLKQNHHLKHYGRLQFNLFLKGIGLPMEESLRFWRTEFSKGSIPIDKFEKEYAYTIRHSYGKEGKRTSYTPYSCLKIITSHMPGNNDHHGCPFKHFERDFLKQKLNQHGRTEDEASQIMEHSDSNNFQIACQRNFEFAHKTEEFVPINHPNQYFEQSMRLLNHPMSKSTNQQQSKPYIKAEHIKIEITQ